MTRLQQSHVLVTGAASGLGRRLALGVARREGSLTLWDLNRDGLDAVAAEARGIGARAATDVVDVSDREAVQAAAKRVSAPVDVLVNNAGVVNGNRILEMSDESIERTFAVNTLALFWTIRAFLPGMIERRHGHLVTIASAGGLIGVPRLADYCASKWAAVGLDESLRVELAYTAPGVRTTVVCPYFIDTGMFAGVKTRFSFLLPILNEAEVCEKILRAIETDKRRLFLPPMVYTIGPLRLLPPAWFDAVARFMGIHAAMDEFVGRR